MNIKASDIYTIMQRTHVEDAYTRLGVQLSIRVLDWRQITPLMTRERIPATLQIIENFSSVGDDAGCLCHNR